MKLKRKVKEYAKKIGEKIDKKASELLGDDGANIVKGVTKASILSSLPLSDIPNTKPEDNSDSFENIF